MATRFEPEITAFYCLYCGYMASDTAGALQIQYPPNVKFVRLPCTGKVDVRYLLQAFEQGADGVYVVACPLGNCHHVRGNERGRARLQRTQRLLEHVGIDPARLDMFFMSGSQAQAFATTAQTMTDRIRELGPNPLRGGVSGPRFEAVSSDVDTGSAGDDQTRCRAPCPAADGK